MGHDIRSPALSVLHPIRADKSMSRDAGIAQDRCMITI